MMTLITDLFSGNKNFLLSINVALCQVIPESNAGKVWFATITIILLFYWRLQYWKRRGIANDAFSCIAQFTKPLHKRDFDTYSTYGRIVGIYDGFTPSLLIGDTKLVNQILVKDCHNFIKNQLRFDGFHEKISGLLQPLMRNKLESIFSIENVKSMIPLIESNIRILISNLETVAINGNPVDMKKYFSALNLDVISNCIFGTEINALQNANEELVKYTRKIFNRNKSLHRFINMFLPSLSAIDRNVWNPLLAYVEGVVNQRINLEVKRLDLLQLLVDCISKEDKESPSIVNNVTDQLLMLLVEGFETTTTALSVAAYCLAYYSDFQQKVTDEIDEKDDGSSDDYKSLSRLDYLNAFVCEVLRLFPCVPRYAYSCLKLIEICTLNARIERRAKCDCKLGNVFIPKGTLIAIPVFAMHRDNSNFKNANDFIPERFIKSNEAKRSNCYLPFGTGQCKCIGVNFAMLIIKLVLLSILRKFKFQMCSQTKYPLQYLNGKMLSIPCSVTLRIVKR